MLKWESSDHALAGYFDLIYDGNNNGALIYLFQQGPSDGEYDISINLVDIHTGITTTKVSLNVGPLDPGRCGLYSPVNPLCRDVKFSKDGRYLATVTLKKECAQGSAEDVLERVSNWEQVRAQLRKVRVPHGAQHGWGQSVLIYKINRRIYSVYIHDLKTGQLVSEYELERPYEPNVKPIQVEFSPKIHFSVCGHFVYLVEETYVYKTMPITMDYARTESVIDSYGWTIDLRKKRATPNSSKDGVNRLKELSPNTSKPHTPPPHRPATSLQQNSTTTQGCIKRTKYFFFFFLNS